jgi:hypothetical protein
MGGGVEGIESAELRPNQGGCDPRRSENPRARSILEKSNQVEHDGLQFWGA